MAPSSDNVEPTVDIHLPPAYDEVTDPGSFPMPYTVSDGTIGVGTVPMGTEAPPPYTEAALKPPEYTVQDPWVLPKVDDSFEQREAWTPADAEQNQEGYGDTNTREGWYNLPLAAFKTCKHKDIMVFVYILSTYL